MENAIAIIGMDCKFPGANNLDEYWELLKTGRSVVRDTDENIDDRMYIKKSIVLDDIDKFDAKFFNISPREAKYIDPQQRIFLESAWRSMENSGYNVDKINDSVGVFAGTGISSYLINNVIPQLIKSNEDYSKVIAQIVHGNSSDYLSSRISYHMNFTGPSLTVQTACSSALTAVHLACRSLLMYECNMAICGGVSVNSMQEKGYRYVKGEIFSKTGKCSPFSAESDGTIFSGGVGTLVLKRYDDAVEDKDYIYAVIRGSSINNDGADKMSYTAPSAKGQMSVIAEALSFGDIEPEDISYIEAHGTGTDIGDQIEISALKRIFNYDGHNKYCKIGSVKGNIGHAIAASGIAGLIKTVLCINKRYLCPSVNCSEVNPKLDIENSPFEISREYVEWKNSRNVLRAGVSSFGMGGSNAHIVLEEYKNNEMRGIDDHNKIKILKLSSNTESSLNALERQLSMFLSNNYINDDTLMFIYNEQRKVFRYRKLIYYRSKNELLCKLGCEHKKSSEDLSFSNEHVNNIASLKKILASYQEEQIDKFQEDIVIGICERLKAIWEAGEDIDTTILIDKQNILRVPLPGYIFEKNSYWIDSEHCIISEQKEGKDKNTISIEKYIINLWLKYLEVDDVSKEDEFFELGGTSLVAYQMIADVEDELQVIIEVDEILDNPTLGFMCELVQRLFKDREN